MKKSALILFTIVFLCCQNAPKVPPQYLTEKSNKRAEIIDLQQVKDIDLPRGYERMTQNEDSFSNFLRQMKLKKDKTVYLFDGRKKGNQSAQFAVLNVSVGERDLQQCDVFIKGGAPGHAVIVMDVSVNKTNGKKAFLLAQSYMPAQDIHILKNPNDNILSPWYSEDFGEILETPEWDFKRTALRRFEN